MHLPRVTVTNATGWQIVGIYASPAAARDWQENLLGKAALRDGDALEVTFDRHPFATPWDLRVDGAGGYRAEWKGLPLAQLSTITLRVATGVVIAELQPLPAEREAPR
jgi:hypothetical protein